MLTHPAAWPMSVQRQRRGDHSQPLYLLHPLERIWCNMSDLFSQFDDAPSPAARGIALVLIGIGALISATATAAFFHVYAASMFSFISPAWSPWLASAAGVFLFEFAAFGWSQIEAKHANTREQITLAAAGKWLALAGSIMTTVVWFSLQSSLIAARLDADATFVISVLGGILVIVGSSGMFLLVALYAGSSAQHHEASAAATLRALRASAKHTVDRETTTAALAASVDQIRRGIPQHADAVAQDAAARYLQSSVQRENQGAAAPRPLSVNGQK